MQASRTIPTKPAKAARPRASKPPKGLILYRGPSTLPGYEGAPIVAVLTYETSNRKTGDMPQLWILRDSPLSPVEAVATGADAAICGDCPHRGSTCYVNVGQAPRAVWSGVQRGIYPEVTPEAIARVIAGRPVRLGAYGDPGALPLHVIESVTQHAPDWTGYTHQWRTRPDLKAYAMASVDSEREAHEAHAQGWRTFRVALPGADMLPREFVCPASDEGGNTRQCVTCRACNGNPKASATQASPVIVIHGRSASKWKG